VLDLLLNVDDNLAEDEHEDDRSASEMAAKRASYGGENVRKFLLTMAPGHRPYQFLEKALPYVVPYFFATRGRLKDRSCKVVLDKLLQLTHVTQHAYIEHKRWKKQQRQRRRELAQFAQSAAVAMDTQMTQLVGGIEDISPSLSASVQSVSTRRGRSGGGSGGVGSGGGGALQRQYSLASSKGSQQSQSRSQSGSRASMSQSPHTVDKQWTTEDMLSRFNLRAPGEE
jgi:hypothetical protein